MDVTEGSLDYPEGMVRLHNDDVTPEPAFGVISFPWYLTVLGWLLNLAKTPRTVGYVPDGNRRYARANGMSVREGHSICLSLIEKLQEAAPSFGIRRLVTFLWSVNNFKRSEEEKSHLFSLVSTMFRNVAKNCEVYRKLGRKVRCVGDLEMFPRDLQRLAAGAELTTRHNSGGLELIFCMAYTSRHQVTRMALKICHAVRDGLLEPSDITVGLINEYNEIEDAPDVDVLLRTSGERRLSDFLLLQCNYSLIYFEKKHFPEFKLRDVWRVLLFSSMHSSGLLHVKEKHWKRQTTRSSNSDSDRVLRQQRFLSWVEKERLEYLLRLSSDDTSTTE
ncbi:unnamed protein product [Ixodes persulcatus]